MNDCPICERELGIDGEEHVSNCIAAMKKELETKLNAALLQLSEAKKLIADWLQHECSVGGPSWEEIESRARAMVADERVEKRIICDCGTPGCNKTFDHRKGGSGFFG